MPIGKSPVGLVAKYGTFLLFLQKVVYYLYVLLFIIHALKMSLRKTKRKYIVNCHKVRWQYKYCSSISSTLSSLVVIQLNTFEIITYRAGFISGGGGGGGANGHGQDLKGAVTYY